MYPLINNSVLPDLVDYISTARLSSINFNNADILKIIKHLNANKASDHNDISVKMIKLCGQSIVKPLSITLKNCIDNGIFPDIWKKSNIIPVHNKGDKQIIDNYRPVSLLLIHGKIFKKLLFNSIFKFFDDNLLSSNQSGFRPPDSCEYQYFQYSMIFIHHLTVVHLLGLEVCFWTYPKHLIEPGMKA